MVYSDSRNTDGVRRKQTKHELLISRISIHAPLTGCDYDPARLTLYIFDISIHAPLTGRDSVPALDELLDKKFQSTHP